MPVIEDANTNYLGQLLAPPPPPLTNDVLAPSPFTTVGYSSEGLNSIAGPLRRESEE